MASRSPAVRPRPLSPHLGIWRWGPHMLVSILHRATGVGVALVGLPLATWWVASLAAGQASYAGFRDTFAYHDGRLNVVGWVVGVGLSLAMFQHMMSGVRHLVLDTGAGFELRRNKLGALFTMACSIVLTILFWLVLEIR